MKENIRENKVKIVEMLNKQVKEGIKIAEVLNISDNVYGIVLTNLLNAHKGAEQMSNELEYDEEQKKLSNEYAKKSNQK